MARIATTAPDYGLGGWGGDAAAAPDLEIADAGVADSTGVARGVAGAARRGVATGEEPAVATAGGELMRSVATDASIRGDGEVAPPAMRPIAKPASKAKTRTKGMRVMVMRRTDSSGRSKSPARTMASEKFYTLLVPLYRHGNGPWRPLRYSHQGVMGNCDPYTCSV